MRILPLQLAAFHALASGLALAEQAAAPKPIDPHALYEAKCSACHAKHGLGLAQKSLKLDEQKRAVTKSGRPLETLLARHHGVKLDPAEMQALSDQFAAMLATGFVFQKKCAVCHQNGVGFARIYLEIRDGVLVSRLHDMPVAKFLETHGRVDAEENAKVVGMLRRHLETKP